MMTRVPIDRRLELGSRACIEMGSSLYGELLQYALADYRDRGPFYDFFERAPEREQYSATGLRLLGALHFLALRGAAPELAAHLPSCGGDGDARAAWSAGRELLRSREREIGELFAETPQTNEVARSMLLLGGALAIAQRLRMPLRIFDIGASAGLNTRLDCYRYEGEDWSWGDPQSPLVLRNRIHSGKPPLGEDLHIVERAACDMNPLDIESERDRTRLLSFLWADQLERFTRLRAAIEAARNLALAVQKADMFRWIGETIEPCAHAATVIMHSIIVEHLSHEDRVRLEATIAGVGTLARREAPVVWLRMEMEPQTRSYETRITLWPSSEEQLIARSDGHAQGIEWSA